MLIGHYCKEMGQEVIYDHLLSTPAAYLLAHAVDHRADLEKMASGSVVVDPWRNLYEVDGIDVINYGYTRR
jgi:hypothetical protein